MATALLDPPSTAPVREDMRAPRWAPSPRIGGAEIAWAAVAGVLLAVLTSWPLALHMSSRIAPDLGDPVRTAWEVAWVGHAMLHDPLHLFDSNAFYPHPLSLAFSDSLLGYGPAAFFGSGTVAALVRYNLLFLWAWSLCFVGAYLLARELGLRVLAAGAAGIAFAYAPYRVTEAGHLHVISSGGIPLALFLLLRGYRRSSRGLVLAGWLVGAWQISLGFTLGLQFAYLLLVLCALVLWEWWRGRLHPGAEWDSGPTRGPLVPRRLLAVTCIGVAVLGAVTVYQARPYLKVAEEYPTAKRTLKEVKNYSSGPAALLSASTENRVWGDATEGMRAKVHSKNEDVFWPGGLILALALAGLFTGAYTRRLRLGLLAGIVVCSVLAMGMGLTGAGYPYRLLYDYAPGWDGVRVPGRVFTLATLFYALLAGAGVQWLVQRVAAWRGQRRDRSSAAARRAGVRSAVVPGRPMQSHADPAYPPPSRIASARHDRTRHASPSNTRLAYPLTVLPALVGVALLIGLLGEGAGHLGHPVVPQPAKAEIGLPGPVLDLPTDGALDRVWQYFSTDGFYKIPVGNSTFDMPAVDDLRGGMNGFPDKASVEKLRYYKIKTVVLHTVLPKGLPPEHGYTFAEPPDPVAAAAKPIAGLGITRRRIGSLVIYEIGPGPAALHGTDG
jgi:MFS family permease